MNLWYGYRDELAAATRDAIEAAVHRVQVLVHRPAARRASSTSVVLVGEPPHDLPRRRVPRRARRSRTTTFTQRRQHRRRHTRRAPTRVHRHVARPRRRGSASPSGTPTSTTRRTSTPLLTLVEWSHDPTLAAARGDGARPRCSSTSRSTSSSGNFGATHGRSYMKDKSVADRPGHVRRCRSCCSTTRTAPYQLDRRPGRHAARPRAAVPRCPR